MARISTDQSTVLQAVVDRLVAQVEGFTKTTCVISDDTEPTAALESNLTCFITPMGGNYSPEWLDGGAENQCHEEAGVVVSVWTAMKLDRSNRTKFALLQAERGLLPIKKQILKALTGHDLADVNGDQLLTSLMKPLNSKHQRRSGDGKSVGFSLSFGTDFLWDLT